MKIEEAMVYLLATSQHGMKTEQIARELELRGLVPRRPGQGYQSDRNLISMKLLLKILTIFVASEPSAAL